MNSSFPRAAARRFVLRARRSVLDATHDVLRLVDRGPGFGYSAYAIQTVPPSTIQHVTRERLHPRIFNRAIGGDWDLRAVPLSETALYRGLHQRYVAGLAWLDTELRPECYRRQSDNEPSKYNRYDVEQFLKRGAYLDRLFDALQREGYRSCGELGRPFHDELAVAVGRDGRLVRNAGGLHRLIMSQLIGLDAVPMRVVAVHPELSASPVEEDTRSHVLSVHVLAAIQASAVLHAPVPIVAGV